MTLKRTAKITGFICAIATIAILPSNAQSIELTPFIGYETGARISGYSGGDLVIGDGMNYGGAINVGLGGGRYGEFSYNHMASDLYLDGIGKRRHLRSGSGLLFLWCAAGNEA